MPIPFVECLHYTISMLLNFGQEIHRNRFGIKRYENCPFWQGLGNYWPRPNSLVVMMKVRFTTKEAGKEQHSTRNYLGSCILMASKHKFYSKSYFLLPNKNVSLWLRGCANDKVGVERFNSIQNKIRISLNIEFGIDCYCDGRWKVMQLKNLYVNSLTITVPLLCLQQVQGSLNDWHFWRGAAQSKMQGKRKVLTVTCGLWNSDKVVVIERGCKKEKQVKTFLTQ